MSNITLDTTDSYIEQFKDISVQGLPKENEKIIQLGGLPRLRARTFNFRNFYYTNNGFEIPEYNLYEISAAEDGDGIIKQAIKRKAALMFKEGFSFNGENDKTVQYIRNRVKQLEIAQGKPFKILFKELGTDYIRFHNAFLLKVRDFKNSGGNHRMVRTRRGVKEIKPVAGYFRMAPETIRIKTDDYGNPTAYRQEMPDGRFKEYGVDEVIHFHFNRRAGFNFAVPGLWPAIDDIRSLRRMEEYLELLTEQYLFPLFIMTIGTENQPAQTYPDGTTEVDVWTTKINQMDINSGLVVSHRHKLDRLSFDNILPINEYLNYFKNRVYVSCGVSGVDLGETSTANKSSSDNASKHLIEEVKDYQDSFAALIEFEVIQELLLEKYDESVLLDQNVVVFSFNEVDLDYMMKKENHSALMYNMNTITETEMRKRNNSGAIKESERAGTFLHQYEIPKAEAVGKIDAATKATVNQAKSRQQPSNQHGKALGPTKRKSSLSGENKLLLHSLLNDFTREDCDLTQIKLTNWLFLLDSSSSSADFCSNKINLFDKLAEDTYQLFQDDQISSVEARDLLFNQIVSIAEEEPQNEQL